MDSAHRRPVRRSPGGVGGLVAATESLDRRSRGRAETSDGRLLLGQVRQERGRITVAVPVGQVMGDQQGQGRVVGGRTARPSLPGGQLFDLAGSGVGARAGRAFPRHAERVAAGIGGQSAIDAPGKVEDVLRV